MISDSSFGSCAYPDWPKRDELSPTANAGLSPGSQASSYITDEDLLDLEQLPLFNDIRIPAQYPGYAIDLADFSLQALKPPVILQTLPAPNIAPPIPKRRRRSSPLKKRKMILGMSPIAEGAE